MQDNRDRATGKVRAQRLVGIERADGFALNVSNFIATPRDRRGRAAFSAGGRHTLCHRQPQRRGHGQRPRLVQRVGPGAGRPRPPRRRAIRLVDAFLWIKHPGESDGTCNGGPVAGG